MATGRCIPVDRIVCVRVGVYVVCLRVRVGVYMLYVHRFPAAGSVCAGVNIYMLERVFERRLRRINET